MIYFTNSIRTPREGAKLLQVHDDSSKGGIFNVYPSQHNNMQSAIVCLSNKNCDKTTRHRSVRATAKQAAQCYVQIHTDNDGRICITR